MSRNIGTEPCPRCVKRGNDTRGDNLVLWENGHGHCFACQYHKFPKLPSFKPLKENVNKTLLPFDFQREIPGAAWQWLLRFGLPYSYWQAITGYSEADERLIFRVGEYQLRQQTLVRTDAPLSFSIGRYLPEVQVPSNGDVGSVSLQPGGGPIVQRNKGRSKWFVYGDCHRHAEICAPDEGDCIVLVEDLISAHKVGQVTTTIPLFGTQVHSPVMYYLLNSTRPVKLWLDKDQEYNVRHTALRLQGILNRQVDVITTTLDPKYLEVDYIKKVLNNEDCTDERSVLLPLR